MNASTPSIFQVFNFPKCLLMICVASRRTGESNLTADLVMCREDFDPGTSDTRMAAESFIGGFRIRSFHPGSGCGLLIESDKITFTEPGLQNLVERKISHVDVAPNQENIYAVWIDREDTDESDDLAQTIWRFRGLVQALT